MSANAETLPVPTPIRTATVGAPKPSWYVAATAALRRWSSRSQLGRSFAADVGRHTGARC